MKGRTYLGTVKDNNSKVIDVYRTETTIELVHNKDEHNEFTSSKNIDDIRNNLDDYLWTPYAEAVSLINY